MSFPSTIACNCVRSCELARGLYEIAVRLEITTFGYVERKIGDYSENLPGNRNQSLGYIFISNNIHVFWMRSLHRFPSPFFAVRALSIRASLFDSLLVPPFICRFCQPTTYHLMGRQFLVWMETQVSFTVPPLQACVMKSDG